MINYYQPFLFQFIGSKQYTLPSTVWQKYYFSWEDGLWDLLYKNNIPKLSTILIPDFYCMDVIENIKRHGYNVTLYPLDLYFTIGSNKFKNLIKKVNPSVIIIFHPAGITSCLIHDQSWLKEVTSQTFIIEDCVHRLVNPEELSFIHPNHIIMDSLRKDSPFRGSFMYGQKLYSNFPQTNRLLDTYTLSSTLLYFLFRSILEMSAVFPIPKLTKYAHEVILQKHDDIIGDSPFPHRGLPFIPFLHKHLNFNTLETIKIKQVKLYFSLINTWLKQKQNSQTSLSFYLFPIPFSDYKKLHVFPLGIKCTPKQGETLRSYLHKKGIIVWIKFPDCPWSKNQQVLFLPLGFHIKTTYISYIVKTVINFEKE